MDPQRFNCSVNYYLTILDGWIRIILIPWTKNKLPDHPRLDFGTYRCVSDLQQRSGKLDNKQQPLGCYRAHGCCYFVVLRKYLFKIHKSIRPSDDGCLGANDNSRCITSITGVITWRA